MYTLVVLFVAKLIALHFQFAQLLSRLFPCQVPVVHIGMACEDVRLEVALLVEKLPTKQIGSIQLEVGAAFGRAKASLDVGGAFQSSQSVTGRQVVDQIKGIMALVVSLVI